MTPEAVCEEQLHGIREEALTVAHSELKHGLHGTCNEARAYVNSMLDQDFIDWVSYTKILKDIRGVENQHDVKVDSYVNQGLEEKYA